MEKTETQKQLTVKTAQRWKSAGKEMKKIGSIAGSGILAALGIIMKPLSIPIIPNLLKISFFFLPTALSGYLYGPYVAGFAAVIIDILGFLIKPDGAFFFGFTLNAFVNGFIYGAWLYRHKITLLRTFLACLTSVVVISLILNPLWLSMLYGEAWHVLVQARLVSNIFVLPLNTFLLFGLLKISEKHKLVKKA